MRDDERVPRGLLFDLDRTLVDLQSFTDYAAALVDLRALVGGWGDVPTLAADWDAPTLECMALLGTLSGDERWSAASAAVAAHERAAIPQSRAMPGLADAVAACAGRPYAVVTLLPPDVARDALDFHGFPVDVVIGRDPSIRSKPAGEGLVVAAEKLGLPISECVMIGDSTWDHAAAVDAGAGFIGVPVTATAFASDVPVARHLIEAIERAP